MSKLSTKFDSGRRFIVQNIIIITSLTIIISFGLKDTYQKIVIPPPSKIPYFETENSTPPPSDIPPDDL